MDLIDREQALGCFWSYANDDGTGYDETEMPAYDRLQALPIVAEVEDCISRQAAIDAVCKAGCESGYCGASCDEVKAIEQLPSAQPEIIRCNVCRHWHQTTGEMKGFGLGDCDYLEKKLVTCNGYCYWAERKEDE